MELMEKAREFESRSMSNMSTSDRVEASREAKDIVLSLNEIYKQSKDPEIMEMMKIITAKKQKIEKRLKGRPEV
ncbi:hypothetical protein [uncultured Aquimarina sp.]|uniref:hypothetical protein n=1 Tax=uncultured Aquimarina sp. TaxID=575652 RepID=UPI002639A89C|nr:hypothetical protein [uncultured Aquimarina sp.]